MVISLPLVVLLLSLVLIYTTEWQTARVEEDLRRVLRGQGDILNKVLDIAKIEAGRLPLNIEPIALAIALQETLSLVSPMAADAGIQLTPLPTLAADIEIVADRQRLTQVLLNLLSNAIKYNRPKGQVSIEVKVEQQLIAVSVCDTGNGIAADHVGQPFKPFYRLGADPNAEGSGLGLALSKSLLEMMKGN